MHPPIVAKEHDCLQKGKVVSNSESCFGWLSGQVWVRMGRLARLRPEYEEQFRRWTAHLEPEDWCGLTFLDVGCGMGRNSYWPMSYGAAGELAIDVDDRSLAAAETGHSRRLPVFGSRNEAPTRSAARTSSI